MSTKTSIAASDNYHLYFDSLFDAEPEEVYISVSNPLVCTVECEHERIVQAVISISTDDMDQMALAWIKKRRIENK